MFAVRRILRNNKQLTNYICTSSVLQCEKDNKTSNLFRRVRKSKKDGEKKAEDMKVDLGDFTLNLRPPKRERTEKSPWSKSMFSSVEKVASELGGDKEQTRKELMEYVKMLDVGKEPEIVPDEEESEPKPGSLSYREWRESSESSKGAFEREGVRQPRKGGKLGIFKKNMMNKEDEVKLKIWDSLREEDLAVKAKRSPENYFEELINWTNEGRLWKFPIDNDQGMDREAATNFTEHVFLEKHLEPWCPKKGPIRKFMEMVLIGLGKNPYLTPKEKRAHIMWFKFYFDEKKKLLQELGAMGPTKLEVSSQESSS